MRLTDEQIIKILEEYINDNRYQQAVLINGEWGSGKTFFVKKKLLNSLEKDLPKYSVFYISLYGVSDLNQIMDEIYAVTFQEFFDNKFGDDLGNKIGKGINLISKIATAGLKHFSIDSADLPKLSDVKQIKDAVFIFDDIERCNIDINQVLGFMNNLVEHNNIKIILVANESEIGRVGFLLDLPQKYAIALDDRILLETDGSNKKNNMSTDKKGIDKNELISRTDQIFCEDVLYKKVREKLIGLTIYYQADIENIYELIVDTYVKDQNAKSELINRRKTVLDIFNKRQHQNIRTLIFGVMAYEQFVKVLYEITFKPSHYLQTHMEKILSYTMELAIRIKLGKKLYSWENTSSETGIVYLEKSILGNSIYGYKFVDTYLLYRYLNPEQIKRTILSLMKEKKDIDNDAQKNDALIYNKLYCWWELEDEEIIDFLKIMIDELKSRKYKPGYFKDIIITLMQIHDNGIENIEYNQYIPLMKDTLEDSGVFIERRYLEVLSNNYEFTKSYNNLAQPLFDIIDNKERNKKEEKYDYLDDEQDWNDSFISKCRENKNELLEDHKFFFYINPDKTIEKLRISNVKQLNCFFRGVEVVYDFENLRDFFKEDASNLHKILENMNVEELSNGKHTRKIALEKIQSKLQQSLESIEK